jgi:beta-glucosidase
MPETENQDLEREGTVSSLLSRMTLAEKAGLMFHMTFALDASAPQNVRLLGGFPDIDRLITDYHIRNLLLRGPLGNSETAGEVVEILNGLQEIAVRDGGLPLTFSSNPRHSTGNPPGSGDFTRFFSKWPAMTAIAALNDPDLAEEYGAIVRQEYTAIGIRLALHPIADLATEPRWMRISGTFGQDADLVAELVSRYIRGMQGATLGPGSVACMTKHFPGGGPQKDGEDPHFSYGKEQIYPSGGFEYHLLPFKAALKAGTSQIMPYYGKPIGLEFEEVGFCFNRQVVTDLLRKELGFDGIVCSDWGILRDLQMDGMVLPAVAWGVEHLSLEDRVLKALDAGVDQFGGDCCPEVIVKLVEEGRLPESRVDESARRLLREKITLGLVDEPFVDPAGADGKVGQNHFLVRGMRAQQESTTVLKNTIIEGVTKVLPLPIGTKCEVIGFDTELLAKYCEPVDDGSAVVTLIKLEAPFDPRPSPFEQRYHAGRLHFSEAELEVLLPVLNKRHAVVAVHLERPVILPEVSDASAALLGFYGASDEAVLDVIFGHASATGRLPFDLPRSEESVVLHPPDLAGGSVDPLFLFGAGIDLTATESDY